MKGTIAVPFANGFTGSKEVPMSFDYSGAISYGPGGDAETWAEVMALVSGSKAPTDIFITANLAIPPGVYDMRGSRFIANPIVNQAVISLADGAQLVDLASVAGQLILEANGTGLVVPLTWSVWSGGGGLPAILILDFNGVLRNLGSAPMIEVPDNKFFVIAFLANGTLLKVGAGAIINAGASSVVIVGAFGGSSAMPDGWLTGPASASCLYQNGAGASPSPLPVNAGFAGGTVQNLLDGTSCTGPATRPMNPFGGNLPVGASVFDQSLGLTGKPIWWDGTQWVDATGAPA